MSEAFRILAELPIEIENYELEGHDREFPGGFTRPSTTVRLRGGGAEGIGEDVVYDVLDHIAHRDAGPVHDLSGPSTLARPASCLAASIFSPTRRRSARRRATTAAGPMSAPRSTSPCARPGPPCTRPSGGTRGRFASSARPG